MKPILEKADYSNQRHAADIAYLMDCYATDPMGGGEPLPNEVITNLASNLAKIPHAFSVICYVSGKPAGLVNCFEAFSTFKCKPLVNIHDVVVVKEYRGLGISHLLLREVEKIALARGCCKITLEVLQGNTVARSSYNKLGFRDYELDPALGKALFWQKEL